MSMASNIAVGGYCEKLLAMIESAEAEKEFTEEELIELIKKYLKETKEACDIGWY